MYILDTCTFIWAVQTDYHSFSDLGRLDNLDQ